LYFTYTGKQRIAVTLFTEAYINSVIRGFLSPQRGESSGCGRRNGLQIWRVAADKGWFSSWAGWARF
jgi:hypothetical protein